MKKEKFDCIIKMTQNKNDESYFFVGQVNLNSCKSIKDFNKMQDKVKLSNINLNCKKSKS